MYTHTQSKITSCGRSNKNKKLKKTVGCLSHRCLKKGPTPIPPQHQEPPVLEVGDRGGGGGGVVGPVLKNMWFKFVF